MLMKNNEEKGVVILIFLKLHDPLHLRSSAFSPPMDLLRCFCSRPASSISSKLLEVVLLSSLPSWIS